jgi:hypothetical protein
MNLFKLSFLIAPLFLFQLSASGQSTTENTGIFDIDFEFQAYPTGLIPGLRLEKGFANRHALHLRLGYNWIRHRDLGVQDDERGDGLGGSLGYRLYFKEGFTAWFAGVRSDIWRNTIDWQDLDDDGNLQETGTTRLLVLQPTAELGYSWTFADNTWVFAPSIALGAEINVLTEGRETGQGAILLIGFTIGKRF